jgi:hypothetical protein
MRRLAICLLVTCVIGYSGCIVERFPAESYAVYDAFLKAQDRGPLATIQISDRTVRATLSPELILRDAPYLQKSAIDDYLQQNPYELHRFADLQDYQIIPESEAAKRGDYWRFSGVGFNRDRSQAVFEFIHACPLCGKGGFVVMKKDWLRRWKVVVEHVSVVS